jgi:hypothetical protein
MPSRPAGPWADLPDVRRGDRRHGAPIRRPLPVIVAAQARRILRCRRGPCTHHDLKGGRVSSLWWRSHPCATASRCAPSAGLHPRSPSAGRWTRGVVHWRCNPSWIYWVWVPSRATSIHYQPGFGGTWRKLHLAVDAEHHEILGVEITCLEAADCEVLPALFQQNADQPLASVTGDGAYDTRETYRQDEARWATAVVPPRSRAALWESGHPRNAADEACRSRLLGLDAHCGLPPAQ